MAKRATMDGLITRGTESAKVTGRTKNQRKVFVTPVYTKNRNCKTLVALNKGSAYSTKSYSIAQLVVEKFINGNGREILVTRKTMPALKMSAYKLVVFLLQEYGYYEFCEHNKSDHKLTWIERKNGKVVKENHIYFKSLDDVDKIKSAEFTDIWHEEATEDTLRDYRIARLRLRAKPKDNIYSRNIYLSFNPIDKNHWIAKNLLDDPEVTLIQSTYNDNPFIDDEYTDYLERLKDVDYNMYRIYALGEWGVLENIIYTNYVAVDRETFDKIVPDDEFYGLDFGSVHATALVHVKMKDNIPYIAEEVYEMKKSKTDRIFVNSDLILKLKELIPPKKRHLPIYADNSEPDRIQEIYDAGFNVHPADKDVLMGIDRCLRYQLHICGANLEKEISGYHRMVDKNGNVLDYPVQVMDHCMDAMRYAMYTHLRKHGTKEDRQSTMDQIKTHKDSRVNIGSAEALGEQYDLFSNLRIRTGRFFEGFINYGQSVAA